LHERSKPACGCGRGLFRQTLPEELRNALGLSDDDADNDRAASAADDNGEGAQRGNETPLSKDISR
jgi:hypothetical protein